MSAKLYDPKCHELAEYFLDDLAANNTLLVSGLAAAIQETVEDWFGGMEAKLLDTIESAPTPEKDREGGKE